MAKFVIDIDSDDSDTLHTVLDLLQTQFTDVGEEVGVEIRIVEDPDDEDF